MIRRRTRGHVAIVLLGALLFAQAAIALAACDMQDRVPALAFSHPEAIRRQIQTFALRIARARTRALTRRIS
jgi:hypothetical protein